MECSACKAAAGRACRSPSGYTSDHHRARRDAAGRPPYKEWEKQGLIPEDRHIRALAVLGTSREAQKEFGIDEALGDGVAVVRHILSDLLGLAMRDSTTLDRLDDAARALVRARGLEKSADVITVLAFQVATLTLSLAGPGDDPGEVFATWMRSQVKLTRQPGRAEQRLHAREA
ncbi:hypothetical protein ACIGYO_33755 [Streptomyces triculaminicus]|uniref:zinc finger domain-containing protein n=1 Tax=Streptomyces triculaminicus TaxID=2816232 RepID=UPI0037D09B5E